MAIVIGETSGEASSTLAHLRLSSGGHLVASRRSTGSEVLQSSHRFVRRQCAGLAVRVLVVSLFRVDSNKTITCTRTRTRARFC